MESNEPNDINELIQLLQQEIPLLKRDNIIDDLKKYFKNLMFDEALNKISLLFILKLSEDENILDSNYNEIKITLENFQELLSSPDYQNIIDPIKDDPIFININTIFSELNDDICYSYLAYKYLKIFGKNSKNLEEILQIFLSEYFNATSKDT